LGSTSTVRGSLVEGNHFVGVLVQGAEATIEATMVRDTLPEESDQLLGSGIDIKLNTDTGRRATATVRSSVLERNRMAALFVDGSDATIEGTVFRDTQPQALHQWFGRGITIQNDQDTGERANATVRASLVDGSRELGIFVGGSDATIEATIVRGTQPQASDQRGGRGVGVQSNTVTHEGGTMTLRASVVEGNRDVGVSVIDASATMEASIVRDTSPRAADGTYGDGLDIHSSVGIATGASITTSLLSGNARAGIAAFGAGVALSNTSLDCNAIHLDGEDVDAGPFSFEDLGGNACGCAGARVECRVLSSHLTSPEPLPAAE